MNTSETTRLSASLKGLTENLSTKADKTIIQKFEKGIQELLASDITKKALKAGDKSPDFKLNNALNKPINLSSILQDGPVILTWYRGRWCPYCNTQLNYLQKELSKFNRCGASLVALTPELPDKSLSTKEKNQLGFEVLTDYNNDVARQFGIVYTLNDELQDFYNNFNKLETFNGVDTNELPIPATYVIDRDSSIKYAFVNTDYRKRAEPSEILSALIAL